MNSAGLQVPNFRNHRISRYDRYRVIDSSARGAGEKVHARGEHERREAAVVEEDLCSPALRQGTPGAAAFLTRSLLGEG